MRLVFEIHLVTIRISSQQIIGNFVYIYSRIGS